MRIGQGFDAHAFSDGRRLVLGGVEIARTHGLAGHSDADVVVHAIIDAMLGAAAAGDIGLLFPSSDLKWKDASSLDMLARAGEVVRSHGHAVGNIDASIVAQEPKLAPYIPAMRQAIASTLGIEVERVSVKATTSDRMGFTGRGEGIAAFAVVLLE
jgi:2-C-methyl-D-erythritol 2,4-cyclodiphosphate synthase